MTIKRRAVEPQAAHVSARVTLSKFLRLCQPQFLHLYNRGSDGTQPPQQQEGLNESINEHIFRTCRFQCTHAINVSCFYLSS